MNKSRIKLFLLLIMSIVFIPNMVFAIEEGNSLNGSDLTSPGSKITFDIKVSSDVTFKKYEADLTYETNVLELIGIENKSNWTGSNSITNKSPLSLKFEHDGGITGETIVATLTFKVKQDASKAESIISLIGKITEANEGTIKNLEQHSKTIQIKSTDNTLKELKVNDSSVVNFSPNTYSYSMQVESNITTAKITAEKNNNTAEFVDKFGPRDVDLEYGENKIEIKVRSASGDEKTYLITIVRNDNRGSNNNLKKIIINSGDVKINFDQNVLEYRIKTYKLTKLDVVCETVDAKAKCEVKAPEKVEIGDNRVEIVVTSEDNKTKTYTIVLNNQDRDIDVTLKSIKIIAKEENVALNPTFNKDVLDYEVLYSPKYNGNIVIIPEISSKSKDDEVKYDEALLESTLEDLKVGSKVEIRVYAPDGTENLYTITFVKDNRINFYTVLFGVIILILLVIFIKLVIDRTKLNNELGPSSSDKVKVYKKEDEIELMKTKRLNKINLE